jgi:hypothetical protein
MHSLYKVHEVIAYRGARNFASEATKWIPTKFHFEGINSSLVELSTLPPTNPIWDLVWVHERR